MARHERTWLAVGMWMLLGACAPADGPGSLDECESCDIAPSRESLTLFDCSYFGEKLIVSVPQNQWLGHISLEVAPGVAADTNYLPDGFSGDARAWTIEMAFPEFYTPGSPFAIRVESEKIGPKLVEAAIVTTIDPAADVCSGSIDVVDVPLIDRRTSRGDLYAEYAFGGDDVVTTYDGRDASKSKLRLFTMPGTDSEYELVNSYTGEVLGTFSSDKALVLEDGDGGAVARYAEPADTGF